MYITSSSHTSLLYHRIFIKYLFRKYFFFQKYTDLPELFSYGKYTIKAIEELKSKDTLIINSWLFLYKLFLKPMNFVQLTYYHTQVQQRGHTKLNMQKKLKKSSKFRKKLFNIYSLVYFSKNSKFFILDMLQFLVFKSKISEFFKQKFQRQRSCLKLELIKIFPEINQNLVFDGFLSTLYLFYFFRFKRLKRLRPFVRSMYSQLTTDLAYFVNSILF